MSTPKITKKDAEAIRIGLDTLRRNYEAVSNMSLGLVADALGIEDFILKEKSNELAIYIRMDPEKEIKYDLSEMPPVVNRPPISGMTTKVEDPQNTFFGGPLA